MTSEPSSQSHLYEDAQETEFFCKRCKSMKFRCEGCSRVVCRCSKNNGHMTGDHYYICLGKDGGVRVSFAVQYRLDFHSILGAGPRIGWRNVREPIVVEEGTFWDLTSAAGLVLDCTFDYVTNRREPGNLEALNLLQSRCNDEQFVRLLQLREDWYQLPSTEYTWYNIITAGGHAYRMPAMLFPRTDRASRLIEVATALVRELV